MSHFLDRLPFARQSWFAYLRLLTFRFFDDNCSQKAASLTYTTLLSVVPMLAILLVILSTMPVLADVREQVQSFIFNNFLPSYSLRTQISDYINNFAEKSVRLTFVGLGVLLFTTVTTIFTIESAFNQIWRTDEYTVDVNLILRPLVMIVFVPSVLGIAFMATGAIKGLDLLNQQVFGLGINWAIWAQLLSFIITIMGFAGMYWFIPKAQVPWKNALIAGSIIAIIFEATRRLFGFAIVNFTSYEAIYGAFAVLPVFLLWVYISWNLILLGVEISYTLTIFDKDDVLVAHPLLSVLDMLNVVYKNHQNGKDTTENQLRAALGRTDLPKWRSYINKLCEQHIIVQVSKDRYRLKTDLSTMTLWQFYKILPYPLPIKGELAKLKEAGLDPWHAQIYENLSVVEKHAKQALGIPLSQLFTSTPIRAKQSLD